MEMNNNGEITLKNGNVQLNIKDGKVYYKVGDKEKKLQEITISGTKFYAFQ
jgi:hypothetical protein